ncbi:hypothetical protein [Tateyamaria sp. Alg231-49]|uniref:hypothetical protein n=1 Tax=Tateyamaria sp. Alg231-49 TaxID=1922219 RepID=UPI00131EF622|nr:hypothetical protein [Tateyamaria sp. Alg231-49]
MPVLNSLDEPKRTLMSTAANDCSEPKSFNVMSAENIRFTDWTKPLASGLASEVT